MEKNPLENEAENIIAELSESFKASDLGQLFAMVEVLNKLDQSMKSIVESSEKLTKLGMEKIPGKWIIHSDDLFPGESTQECDQCHHHQPFLNDSWFCPNCGSPMMGEKHGFGGDHG